MECRVGLPTDGITRWRCDICSMLNVYSNDECLRCKEPMSKERKQKNILLPQKKSSATKPVIVKSNSNNNYSFQNSSSTSSSSSNSSRRSSTSMRNAGKSVISQNNKADKRRNRNSKNSKNKSVNNNTFGFDSKGNGKISKRSVGQNNNYKMKKLKKEDLSEKHLGYKSSKKRNVNTFVRSRLNHDTASYRAKGSKNPNDKKSVIKGMKKGTQYATINDLTRNGFQTTLSNPNKNKKMNAKNSSVQKKQDPRFRKLRQFYFLVYICFFLEVM